MPVMISSNTPLDLDEKAALAVARYVQTNPELRGVEVTTQVSEDVKRNGTIVVTAKRSSMVGGQNSGIWSLVVAVEFKVARRANANTAQVFQRRCTELASMFELDFKTMAARITSCYSGEFHCYFVQVDGDDKTPTDDRHRYELSLLMEAMPVSYQTGLKNVVDMAR